MRTVRMCSTRWMRSLQHTNTAERCILFQQTKRCLLQCTVKPHPFERYHHSWLQKSLSEEKRIKNLPIPTLNAKKIPLIDCIMQHLIKNGPSTLDSIWRGIRLMGVIRSKNRLRKQLKRWNVKYADSLPMVNVHTHNRTTQSEIIATMDESDSDDAESEISEIESDSEISSSSGIATDSDDMLQFALYDIRPEKKERIVAKYAEKWETLQSKLAENETQLETQNGDSWYYSVNGRRRPVCKGPLTWPQLMERLADTKQSKSTHVTESITRNTPVFNFVHLQSWQLLKDVQQMHSCGLID